MGGRPATREDPPSEAVPAAAAPELLSEDEDEPAEAGQSPTRVRVPRASEQAPSPGDVYRGGGAAADAAALAASMQIRADAEAAAAPAVQAPILPVAAARPVTASLSLARVRADFEKAYDCELSCSMHELLLHESSQS